MAAALVVFICAVAWQQARPQAETGASPARLRRSLGSHGRRQVTRRGEPGQQHRERLRRAGGREPQDWGSAVGREPRGIAVTPDGSRVYVANTVDGSVSVLDIAAGVQKVIPAGTEPYGAGLDTERHEAVRHATPAPTRCR